MENSDPNSTTSEDSAILSDLVERKEGTPTTAREWDQSTTGDVEREDEFVVRSESAKELMRDRETWYGTSHNYWTTVPSTVDGMLGGYEHITHVDLAGSAEFLAKLLPDPANRTLAIDCGAGIGRITKGLLLNCFERVEMLDTCQEHLDSAEKFIGEELFKRVTAQHCVGLQDFKPEPNKYDMFWLQWVIIYLSDADFITMLQRFKAGLREGGYILIKDNVTKSGSMVDSDDSSITRSDLQLKQIFSRAGCQLVKEQVQRHFPRELFKVKYYVLQ